MSKTPAGPPLPPPASPPSPPLFDARELLRSLPHRPGVYRMYDANGEALKVTASLGLVEWNEQMSSVAELMHEADRQLYRAKALGRNRVCTPVEQVECGAG